MVRCRACGLLRSNPILPASELARLYERSGFHYEDEARFTRRTYGRLLERALRFASGRDSLLEIGCGSGFFLEEARRLGFRDLAGVEPSEDAVARADASLQNCMKRELYGKDSFPEERFDFVCAFQVFDHVPDPSGMLRACFSHLKKGGVALFVNHDEGALSARLLGERSPIVDVEHTALYRKATMRRIFEKHGFSVRAVFSVRNTYPLSYWAKLAPLPKAIKAASLFLLEESRIGALPLTLAAGNLGLVAVKEAR
jgi:SAM-dependent methyltransferase